MARRTVDTRSRCKAWIGGYASCGNPTNAATGVPSTRPGAGVTPPSEIGLWATFFDAMCQTDDDIDDAWDAVWELRYRATDRLLHLMITSCDAEEPLIRARALDVLAQFDAGRPIAQRPHRATCVDAVVRFVDDPDHDVVHAAAWALAHLGGETAAAALATLQQDPDPHVRLAVAYGMANDAPGSVAITSLLALMNDASEGVRYWATMCLGSFRAEDSEAIRAALEKAAKEKVDSIHGEALIGLARRGVRSGIFGVLLRLEKPCTDRDVATARKLLGLPDSAPLEELKRGLRVFLFGVG